MPARPIQSSTRGATRVAAVHYRIRPSDPGAHLFGVEMTIAQPQREGQRLSLPAWIPGSYMIRDFARHIVRIDALTEGRPVRLDKLDKHTWQAGRGTGPLTVRYLVYAWDLSVRGAHLDQTHGFFNGTSVFLRVHGQEHLPCEVIIDAPQSRELAGWRLATTLPGAGARRWGFGRDRAADYDELIDHPVEMGRFTRASFTAGDALHDIAITGRHDTDTERLCKDLSAICSAQIALFDPVGKRAPLERFLFQVMAIGDGYGGLEHRSSTALVCKRSDLPYPGMSTLPDGYRSFLGLASHEYFHLWHVKRIKPERFVEYDLEREHYTRLLWVFEGFTSYYDDLMLVRSGTVSPGDYLQLLSGTISSVLRNPGRFAQSVADSSFDAWTRYYRQDENSPNSIVSYYAKGALVALCIDLAIRAGSGGHRSLDDVMRLMWIRYGQAFYSGCRDGLPEDGLAAIVAEATGIRLDREIRQWSEGTAELPLVALMHRVGLKLALEPPEHGGATIGAKLALRDGMPTLVHAFADGPAQRSGLSAGDAIVAVDGLRVADERALKSLLQRRKAGTTLRVHAFRRDELFEFTLHPRPAPLTEARLSVDRRAGRSATRMRTGWLSG
jgi:predicted metalloprotease with PDZ domain